ncbi:hypothetical protein TGME49_219370 [Toxoplasma gondii ME49]|uniref:Uncharacterized protein n=2 Tax=Toxoplasma gondii TaxID=5811 RepID=S8EQV0_TOXGM|nr:hypothetical protein TGME49_219370 [Toxoplasma gondii ME49]EPT24612.1 hypothetical protein TGME49_219370 [Toxoplasma gondii ME49]KYF48631.1 hypothetical protein TGARI_219370 [Toxoplasma gondii ARI]|eukprot:XP_018634803.1 hypothetical protein TGME49_219370 [Toxoplasma gondii ME49]
MFCLQKSFFPQTTVTARRLRGVDSKATAFPLPETFTVSPETSTASASPFRRAKEEKAQGTPVAAAASQPAKQSVSRPSSSPRPKSSSSLPQAPSVRSTSSPQPDASLFPPSFSSLLSPVLGETALSSPRSTTPLSFAALASGVPGLLSTDALTAVGDVSALLRSQAPFPTPDVPALAQAALNSVGLASPSFYSSPRREQNASASSSAEPEGLLDGNGNSLLDNVLGGGLGGNLLGGNVGGTLLGGNAGGSLLGGNVGGNLLGGGGVGSLLSGGALLGGNDRDRFDRPEYTPNSGNGTRPNGNGFFGNKQKCCSDCRKGDMDCLADCQRGNCSQNPTCEAAEEGAYAAYCQERCGGRVGGRATRPLVTAGCRSSCAAGVALRCEKRMCREYGCTDNACSRKAPLMCG